jgi:hypothetical protein
MTAPASQTAATSRLSVLLSATEVAVGGAVHALHLPFGGHVLSLNQGLLLTLGLKGSPDRADGIRRVSKISSTAALMKSLSPAGKRLTPMLAISTQGWLYAAGLAVCGPRLSGALFGMLLLTLWGFAQPALVAYLIFGSQLFEGILKVWGEIARFLSLSPEAAAQVGWGALALVIGTKVVAGLAIAACAWLASPSFQDRYLGAYERWAIDWKREREARRGPPSSRGASLLRDLTNPWFLIGTALSISFFAFSRGADATRIALYGARVIGGAMLLSWGAREAAAFFRSRSLSRASMS